MSDVLDSQECFYSQEMKVLWLMTQQRPAESFSTVWGLARSLAVSAVDHDDYLLDNDNKQLIKLNRLLPKWAKNAASEKNTLIYN